MAVLVERIEDERRLRLLTSSHFSMTESTPTKRLFIKTYGCQMNVYDSERMADVLRPLGYAMTDEAEGADLVVLNTRYIREKKPARSVYSELGRIKRMKARRQGRGGRRR